MELGDDDIKNLYSSKLSSFQPEVPSFLWDKIEGQLEEATQVVASSKYALKEKILKLTFWTSGVAAMIVAVVLLIPSEVELSSTKTFRVGYENLDRSLLQNMNKESVASDPLPTLLANHNIIKITDRSSSKRLSEVKSKEIDLVALDNSSAQEGSIDSESKTVPIVNLFVDTKENPASSLNDELDEVLASKIEDFANAGKQQEELLDNLSIENNDEKLQLGISGGGSLFSSSKTKNNLNSRNPNMGNFLLRSGSAKMTHNQPINFGISINKRLSKRLSVESGLTYTYLSSTIGADISNNLTQRDKQYFHYLGIPLSLNYTLLELRKFKLYSSLGAMIQMDFYGRRTSDTYLGRLESETYIKDKISQRNPQFSVLGGFGVSYPIYDKLRLYTNLGAAYYFDANNQYETIYSDKKWLFNLDIGIKFEF